MIEATICQSCQSKLSYFGARSVVGLSKTFHTREILVAAVLLRKLKKKLRLILESRKKVKTLTSPSPTLIISNKQIGASAASVVGIVRAQFIHINAVSCLIFKKKCDFTIGSVLNGHINEHATRSA